MGEPLRVLIVEDSEIDMLLVLNEIRRGGYEPVHQRVDSAAAMREALNGAEWDIVLSDYAMPQFSGLDALRLLQESGRDLPFIVLSGTIGDEVAVETMKAGAHDYLLKNNLARLVPAIRRELKEAQDRRERVKAQNMILYLAYHDPLTGLFNRIGFELRLKEAIQARSPQKNPFAVLMMDIDHFKAINDSLGHHHGNLLLKEVGVRLRRVLKESDKIARVGGDEFAVMIPSCDSGRAVQAAGAILTALEEPFLLESLSLFVAASIGISVFPGQGENPTVLMQHADVAMYAAKQNAGGYALYTPEQDKYSPRLLMLMSDLHRAISENELFLVYQPKISLKTSQTIGVEGLVRWRHPKLGIIPPEQFVSITEDTGLIKPLTLWVANEAIRQAHAWYQAGWKFPVAVNISTRNLLDPQLPEHLAGLLSTWGVPAQLFEMEVTESAIMKNPLLAMETARRLSGMGMRITIDDFGTGYSSLTYLKKLPVDSIKIDKTFVKDMVTNEDDREIVRSTIELAHNLKLSVTAEGVETQETWEQLAALNCNAAQGFYMSAPLPSPELALWLQESAWGLEKDSSPGPEPSASPSSSKIENTRPET